jgi:polyisoprenoid-binding protein YceI
MTMNRMTLTLAGAVALATGAVVAAQTLPSTPPGKPDPTLVTGGTYAVEGSHSQILFDYTHFGFTQNMGLLSGPTGTLVLDPKAPGKTALSIEVPVNTLRTTIAKLDEEMQEPNFFDAAKFPTAKFVSTSVQVSGTSAHIMGNLTIKGITKPAVLDAKFVAAGTNPFSKRETVTFEGMGTVKRSDFGLGMAVPVVSDAVQLHIVAAFEKQ